MKAHENEVVIDITPAKPVEQLAITQGSSGATSSADRYVFKRHPAHSNHSQGTHQHQHHRRRHPRRRLGGDDDLCCNILPFVVTALAVSAYLLGAVVVVPYIFSDSWMWILLHETLGLFEITMLLVSYFRCMRASPGIVQPDWHKQLDENEREFLLTLEPNKHGKPRYCHTCGTFKPPRAHHSSVNNKCVLKMDHYCIWVNNVVGAFNHKFFFLFFFYTALGMVHFYVISATGFIRFAVDYEAYQYPFVFIIMLIFSVFLCPMSFMVFAFLGWQIYLIVTNQTSIEFHTNSEISSRLKHKQGKRVQFKHIYSVTLLENINSFLGYDPWYWLLPVKYEGCDGIRFPVLPHVDLKKYQSLSMEASLEESEGEDENENNRAEPTVANYDCDDEHENENHHSTFV